MKYLLSALSYIFFGIGATLFILSFTVYGNDFLAYLFGMLFVIIGYGFNVLRISKFK